MALTKELQEWLEADKKKPNTVRKLSIAMQERQAELEKTIYGTGEKTEIIIVRHEDIPGHDFDIKEIFGEHTTGAGGHDSYTVIILSGGAIKKRLKKMG